MDWGVDGMQYLLSNVTKEDNQTLYLNKYCNDMGYTGLIFAGVMLFLFGVTLLFIIYVVLLRVRKSRIFQSELVFYSFVLLYVVLRIFYFFFVLFMDHKTVTDNLYWSERSVTQEVHIWLTATSYHLSSIIYYCAFLILIINYAENLFLANGMSLQKSKNETMDMKLIVVCIILGIIVTEIAILCTRGYYPASDKGHSRESDETYRSITWIASIVQRCFHSFCAAISIIMFSSWMFISGRRVVEGLEYNRPLGEWVKRVSLFASVLCIILVFKFSINLSLAAYIYVSKSGACPNLEIVLASLTSLFVDILPIIKIMFTFRKSTVNDSMMAEETEVMTNTGGMTGHLLSPNRIIERDNMEITLYGTSLSTLIIEKENDLYENNMMTEDDCDISEREVT
ncbi:hypothetical protein AKO1_011048 [Acrasis kona]|uniref:Uncharacterized protein n=1 Tax=Acrasis kona TaxID=1008807 RepID=A0AAW2YTZ6_9EUKA